MLSKFVIIAVFLITSLGLQVSSCNHSTEDKWVSLGSNKQVSFVVFFKKGITNNEVESFIKDVIQIKKYNLALMFRLSKNDYDGVGVTFSTDTTLEQREQLGKSIRESSIVYRVFENVVPSDVKLE
jgi:hypothetical protein